MDLQEFATSLQGVHPAFIEEAINRLPDSAVEALLADMTGARGQAPAKDYGSPGKLMCSINPELILTPALKLLNARLMEAVEEPDSRLCVTFAPQEGKSTTVSVYLPILTLMRHPDTRIIIAASTQSLAESFSRQIRDIIRANPQLGLKISRGLDRQAEFRLEGHRGGVVAVGVGGTLNGKPGDLLIIDDPNKDYAEAASSAISQKVFDWYQGTAAMRLSPGAPVIVLQTRWHQNDLIGRLLDYDPDRWSLLRIPAQADHRPEYGETDVLGREPGEFMISARGRSQAQWEQRKKETGPRMFAAQFQGVPSPDEGGIFPGEWARYDTPLWTERADGSRLVPGIGRADHELIQSWDLAFKGGQTSDFVVGQVWLRVGSQAYLLDMVRARMNFTETLDAIKTMSARWPQAYAKYVEDKANGPAVMQALTGQIGGLIPVTPEGGKEARANAVSAFAFSGDIILPASHLLPNVGELLEELKLFPASSHDDSVDALTQAVSQLLLYRIDDGAGESVEMYEDYEITPY